MSLLSRVIDFLLEARYLRIRRLCHFFFVTQNLYISFYRRKVDLAFQVFLSLVVLFEGYIFICSHSELRICDFILLSKDVRSIAGLHCFSGPFKDIYLPCTPLTKSELCIVNVHAIERSSTAVNVSQFASRDYNIHTKCM